MYTSRAANAERKLAAAEAELHSQLLAVLPRVGSTGESLFFNSGFLPDGFFERWLPSEAEPLYTPTCECIELREQLTIATTGSLAAAYLAACAEASTNDPHRRGRRLLAASLLVESYELQQQRMAILEGIARGEVAVAEGRVVDHAGAKARLARWLK